MKKEARLSYIVRYIGILLFSNYLPMVAQPLDIKINWVEHGVYKSNTNEVLQNRLKFEGASYKADETLPLYLKSIKLTENNPQKVYYINKMVFEAIPDSILNNVQLPETIPSTRPRLRICYGREDKFLDIELITLRYNVESGILERLVAFSISDSIDTNKKIPVTSGNIKKVAASSILAEGNWYKVRIVKDGIHKLTYADLLGMGITNPANIRVYGNGGKQLSYLNDDSRPVDLNECPIFMSKGSDDIFNDGDFILFYAQGPVRWNLKTISSGFDLFKQSLHEYSNAAYYFLTCDKGSPTIIPTVDNKDLINNIEVNSFTDYAYFETKKLNLIQSGRGWYSKRIDYDTYDTIFNFPDIINDEPVKIISKLAGRSNYSHIAKLLADNNEIARGTVSSIVITYANGIYARELELKGTYLMSGNSIKVGVNYEKYEQSDAAFIDYITINVRRNLRMSGDVLFFRDERSVGSSNISRFTLQNTNANTTIWDVTDVTNIFRLNTELSGSIVNFKAPTDKLHDYVAFDITADYPKPELINNENNGKINNQNLRGTQTVNYIIVTPEVFKLQADSLAAFHRDRSKLSVLVVTPEEIYNEFSSGAPDVSALRDFFKYQYENSIGDNTLKYVLLFGDGSYVNHLNVEGNTNYILTYQSEESLDPINSFVSDDFFGLLDESDDIETNLGKLEIGVGRLPVKIIDGKTTEAELMVNKIIGYYNTEKADWMSSVCFMGDDKSDENKDDGMDHMLQADGLAKTVEEELPGFDIKKIYLDAYQQKTSSTGPSFPDAQKELFNTINKGVLVWNYTGHGGPGGITAEKVFQAADVDNLKNKEKLFLFITASCSVSRYDDVVMDNENSFGAKNSCGELVLLNPDGGAIALFSTTRVVGSVENYNLNIHMLEHLFDKDSLGARKPLGDVIREAKNDMPLDNNKLNFALLGDPALILQYPEYKVYTDSINHFPIEYGTDTIMAFQKVTVSGHLAFDDGTEIVSFNGFVYPRVYDKPDSVTTIGNDGMVPITYLDQKNIIYKGKATVTNGRFTFSFIVPIDISYSKGKGKICYYADNDSIDAQGEFDDVVIGGTSEEVVIDNDGPFIELFMNDERFKDGGMTNSDPVLFAKLTDESGINTTGIGIGHNIMGVLDDDHLNSILLNDYYQASEDDSRSGKVIFPFSNLEKGEHNLYLKAWDIFNNSSDASISFRVIDADGVVLEKVINYPNPAIDKVIFQYTHNAPDEVHNIILEVFDLTGRIVVRYEKSVYESGFVSSPLEWDLTTRGGGQLQTGVYPYRLTVQTSLGTSSINQKLIILK
jgi:hypothetical protein